MHCRKQVRLAPENGFVLDVYCLTDLAFFLGEHHMMLKALTHGVGEERMAGALDVDIGTSGENAIFSMEPQLDASSLPIRAPPSNTKMPRWRSMTRNEARERIVQ